MSKAVNYEERRQSFQVEHALGLCNTHPDDPEVLLTENPDGLYACRDPHVKAIIWQRELPQDVALSLKKSPLVVARMLDFHSIAFNSETQKTSGSNKRNDIRMDKLLGKPIQDDIQKLNVLFCAASGHSFARGSFFHSKDLNDTFHSDGGYIRLHTAYIGTGLEWFAMPAPSRSQYNSYNKRSTRIFLQKELCSHFTNTGDVTLFKGQFSNEQGSLSNHHVPDDHVAGLMHSTPQGTETRLIYTVDDSYDP